MRKLIIKGLGLTREFENELQEDKKIMISTLTKEEKNYIVSLIIEEQIMNLGLEYEEEIEIFRNDNKELYFNDDTYAYIETMGFGDDREYFIYESKDGEGE